MLHLLDGVADARAARHSGAAVYEALDVEQIGHVYEALRPHRIAHHRHRLALSGKHEPELPLGDIEAGAAAGEDTLLERLGKETAVR